LRDGRMEGERIVNKRILKKYGVTTRTGFLYVKIEISAELSCALIITFVSYKGRKFKKKESCPANKHPTACQQNSCLW
jgi:hypothetical protein